MENTVNAAYNNDLYTIIFTNATRLDTDTAQFLYDKGVSLVLSVDTFSRKTYNYLVVIGGYDAAMEGIDTAITAGFNEGHGSTRLAFNTVILKQNLLEIPMMAQYVEIHNIRFFLDQLFKLGRAVENWSDISPDETFMRSVLEPYGLWPVDEFFLKPEGCILVNHGIAVMADGDAKSCPDSNIVIGDIQEDSLEELMKRKEQSAFNEGCFFPGKNL